jgi:PKD repeat protein
MFRRFLVVLILLAATASGQLVKDAGPTTEPWRPVAGGSLAADFRVLISPGVAPAVVHVNGTVCPLPAGTPLTTRYDWDFGDPAGRYNRLTGFNAAHLYDHGGTYLITLTVTGEDGAVRTTTAKVLIAPNTRKSLFVSPDGSDRNDGRSEDAPLRSLPQAFNMLTDGCEIRLLAGGTFNVDSTLQVHKSDVLIGRYGVGADPVLMLNKVDGTPTVKGHHGMIALDNRCDGVLIERITVDSPYGVAETDPAPKVGIDSIIVRGRNITFREMTFNNVDTAINANGNPMGMLVQDCRAPSKVGLRAYLIWGQGTDHVYLGNMVANSTREHCIRLSSVDRVLIFGNDFTNLNRQNLDKDDYSKGTVEMHRGSYAYIAGNTVHDGTIRVGPLGLHGEDAGTATDWAVIENNRVTNTKIYAVSGAHHIMMRNNLIFADDSNGFEITGPGGDNRTNGDLFVLNNTVVNNGTKGSFIYTGGHVDGITVINNLFVSAGPRPAKGGTSAIYTESADLADFRAISHNVWPTFGGGAVVFTAHHGRSAEELKAMPQYAGNNVEADVSVDSEGTPTTAAGATVEGEPLPAVRFDRQGKPRPAGKTTAGAVEIQNNKNH